MIRCKSLRHTIQIGLLVSAAVLLSLFTLLLLESRDLYQESVEDHVFMRFLNTILEARRYEKSYILFHNKGDLDSSLSYLDQVDQQLREYRAAFFAKPNGRILHAKMVDFSAIYRERLLQYPPLLLGKDENGMQALELAIHQVGKQLTSLGEELAADTWDDIRVAWHNVQRIITIAIILSVIMLLMFVLAAERRIIDPLARLRDGLTGVMEARQEQIEPLGREREFVALTSLVNQTLKTVSLRSEEHTRKAQKIYTDALLVRLVKMLGQPMDNISTASQILMEEASQASVAFQQEMFTQIRQQAEHGRGILSVIQEYAAPPDESIILINLAKLINNIVLNLRQTRNFSSEWGNNATLLDVAVLGNLHILDRGLADLINHALRSTPAHYAVTIKGRRLNRGEMEQAIQKSTIVPLICLPAECREVAEISLPVAGEIYITPDQSIRDVSFLCLPQEDGHPGICMLPSVISQHGGAMLVEVEEDSVWMLRLWFPTVAAKMNGFSFGKGGH
ncbi:MAG: hypothetical protein H7836_05175 [Magnetococcus sp. YQC-3]